MSASKFRIYFRLQYTAGVVKKAADRILMETASITAAQAGVLTIVNAHQEMTQKDLAQTLGLKEAAVTTMVNRLGKLGYLERVRHPEDKRAWILSVTGKGMQVLDNIAEPFGELNQVFDSALDPKELSDFADKLDLIGDKFAKFKISRDRD